MKELKLTNSSKVTTISDDKYDLVGGYPWYLIIDRSKHTIRVATGSEGNNIYLAHLILPPKEGFTIDHIDRDPLNNQTDNLRYATRSQQEANKSVRVDNTSGYKGVTWHGSCQKWMVR